MGSYGKLMVWKRTDIICDKVMWKKPHSTRGSEQRKVSGRKGGCVEKKKTLFSLRMDWVFGSLSLARSANYKWANIRFRLKGSLLSFRGVLHVYIFMSQGSEVEEQSLKGGKLNKKLKNLKFYKFFKTFFLSQFFIVWLFLRNVPSTNYEQRVISFFIVIPNLAYSLCQKKNTIHLCTPRGWKNKKSKFEDPYTYTAI